MFYTVLCIHFVHAFGFLEQLFDNESVLYFLFEYKYAICGYSISRRQPVRISLHFQHVVKLTPSQPSELHVRNGIRSGIIPISP